MSGFGGRTPAVHSSGLTDTIIQGGGFAPGADIRAFVLQERIPHLPGARCRELDPLFDEQPDDSEGVRRTERALAICNTCPALQPCEAWLRRLDPPQRPRGVVAGRVIKSRGVIPKDRQLRVSYYHAAQ